MTRFYFLQNFYAMVLQGFPPNVMASAKVLILGSMPGRASLAVAQYYAHKRNLFWPFMAEILESSLPEAYAERLAWLQKFDVALWDVLRSCERAGSLDSNIVPESELANPLPALIEQLPDLKAVIFNGAKAEKLFKKHCMEQVSKPIAYHCLPSTSPANASMSRQYKLEEWLSTVKNYLN